ncbi:MAG: zeta toxin family protein [Deltaproteobacteria bacterium]|nr:zeta toxin family protein [Deltaproteobacteria bacterium]
MNYKNIPHLYIIAGPNGSGKTTFAKEFLPQYVKCPNFINADMIAQGLAPFSPQTVAIKAGRLLLSQIQEYSSKKVDFAFETTLSGKTYASLFRKLKKKGYEIHLFFLWIPSAGLALERIKERVAKGGHNIPIHDVRRRFARSIHNFFDVYKLLVDSWSLFDNSNIKPHLIAKKEHGKVVVYDEATFKIISSSTG